MNCWIDFALALFWPIEKFCVVGIMNSVMNFTTKAIVTVLIGSLILETGCSRAPTLSPNAAAQLAAKLANERCDHLYQNQPFSASQHLAVLSNGIYSWGGFDPAGPEGFSALVTFRANGNAPHVEVFFSCDPPLPAIRPHFQSPPGGLPIGPLMPKSALEPTAK